MQKTKRYEALQRQIARLERRLVALAEVDNRYTWVRLSIFLAGFALAVATFLAGYPRLWWFVLSGAALVFVVVVHFHQRVEEGIGRHRYWRDFKQSQLARMDLDWEALPPTLWRAERPLERDFDLVGPFSLHRLLDTAVTPIGSQRLRRWLAAPSTPHQTTIRRQKLVSELTPRPLLREKLGLYGAISSTSKKEPPAEAQLLGWLQDETHPPPRRDALIFLAGLVALNWFLFIFNLGPWWQASLVIYFAISLLYSRSVGEPFREAAQLRDRLEQLTAVFNQLETFSYQRTPHLAQLCQPFLTRQERPSTYLGRLNGIVNATGLRGNPVLWLLLNTLFPWDYYFAYRLHQARTDLADRLPGWLDIWHELEALNSLANFAYLNPHYTMPDVQAEVTETALFFQTRQLGHPLLPEEEKVCNDLTIDRAGQILLFTGSNMSGKSTFLRTVGLNLLLAYAGGPVNAADLQAVSGRLWACMRVTDSVTDGVSYFYAEVQCLRGLLQALQENGGEPLFYFIDEIFRGTNNRERLAGSRAYITALARQSGVGLISTHDLELVNLADKIPAVHNYHFRDDVQQGRMVFHYKLHPGPCPTTNALKIMALAGLPVEGEVG